MAKRKQDAEELPDAPSSKANAKPTTQDDESDSDEVWRISPRTAAAAPEKLMHRI